MRALFLANVGNRDVWVDGKPLAAEQARVLGESMLRQYEQHRDRLSAPILETGLRHVLARGTAEDPVRVRVCLFATNQDESAGQHRTKDTVYLAQALKRWLPERFPKSEATSLEEVWVVEIRQNPSYYDRMHGFFGEQFRGKRFSPDLCDACYVSPVGGVPAANFALLLRAVEHFAERCHPIYVPEGSEFPVAMDVGEQLRRGLLRAVARQEVEQYEFGRAAALLRRLGAGAVEVGLAEHAQHRMHFDFQQATRALEEQVEPGANDEQRRLALRLRAGLEKLLKKQMEALIGELSVNARVTYLGGRYVDFLLRAFRLNEAALRLIVERELGLPTDAVQGKAHRDFVAGIEADPALKAHFEQPFEGKKLRYDGAPNRPVLRHLVGYYLAHAGEQAVERYGPLVALLDRFEGLADLRNKSIGGHGFEGVSEEVIRQRYGQAFDLLADLDDIRRLHGLADDNPFAEVRAYLLEWLAREG